MQHEIIELLEHNLNQIIYLSKQQEKKGLAAIFSALNFSKDHLYKKNWTLVIGTQHSGKTSFLQQTDLQAIHEDTDDAPECNTWYNDESVFIELPSLSLNDTEENYIIRHFLNTIKTYRKKKPFDNILLTIDMYAFIHEYDQYIHYLEATKNQIQKTFSQYFSHKVNIYIVFTHMDKVAGFCDFFSEFSNQNPNQALGYLLDEYHSNKKLQEQTEKKYDRLLARLHENLISLLHKTRNNLTRYLIREFPQQLDSLRNMIRSSVSLMAEINEPLWKVKGVFFSSARQSGICVDRITIPISQSYQLTLPNHFPQASREQSYFIKGIVKITSKNHLREDTRFARYRREHKRLAYVGYMVTALLLIFIGAGYHYTLKDLDKTASAIQHYQKLSHKETFSTLLPELNYLTTARNTLNHVNPWFIPFKNLKTTKHWINSQYQKALSEQFLPQVAHKMEEWLVNERNPAIQYAILKAYLMLGEPQYLDPLYLKHWLHDYLNFSSTADLKSALLQPFPGITLNRNIIEQVRNNLNTLPPQHLIYILIKNKPEQFIPINNETFNTPASAKGVPNFYTRAGFEKQYIQTIPVFTQKIIDENWILKNTNFSSIPPLELINQVRELYLADYLNWWQLFVYHTQPKSFNTWEEAANYFGLLTKEKTSPLSTMLDFIQSNTRAFENPNHVETLFNNNVATPLASINTISLKNFQSLTEDTPSAPLNALNHYFSIAASSTNKGLMAFNTTKQKFLSPTQEGALNKLFQAAKNMPQPVAQWLNQIASNSWFLILGETKNYINQQWKNLIISEYQQNIQGRFPFTPNTEQEVSIENFTHFFNRSGTLSLFIENYLNPFLNREKAQWVTKKVDGFELPISSLVIQEFELSNVIREMFFPNHATTPNIHFVIQAMELQPIVNSIALNINGQILRASQTSKKSQAFYWPGNYTNVPVTLALQNITGEQFQTTEYGPWGIFRLLSQANIQSISSDSRTLQIVFDLNGSAAEYLLRTTNPLNPFIPNIIQAFELPDELL